MSREILGELKQIIASDLDVKICVSNIDANEPLFNGGLGLDSMAIVDLICAIEDRFDFEFSDSELRPEMFENLQVLSTTIQSRLAD